MLSTNPIRLTGLSEQAVDDFTYRIISPRTACRYGTNFTRVPLYVEVQRHAVVNEGIFYQHLKLHIQQNLISFLSGTTNYY